MGNVGGATPERPSTKIDSKIFQACPFAKIGPCENLPLYSI